MPRTSIDTGNKTLSFGNIFKLTPTDENGDEEKFVTDFIWVGVGGDIEFLSAMGQREIMYNIPSGKQIALRVRKIFDDGTSAREILGMCV